ncbi:archaeal proteasome endopeptidase complex subunit beta [Candidatus Aenigmatarchaeota archaeon]
MKTQEKLETGTTTVGLKYKDGVVLVTDMKSTLGYLVASKAAQKIYQIDENIGVTTAGGSGDTQALVRLLRAEINIYKLTRHSEFTVRAAKALLSNILQGTRYYPYMAMMIVGGMDKRGPHVYSVDPVGGAEKDTYTATGSGSPIAYGILEDGFKNNMTKDDALNLAVRSIKSARKRDIFSGGDKILASVIDNRGFRFVDVE